jgi:hypothetical protein
MTLPTAMPLNAITTTSNRCAQEIPSLEHQIYPCRVDFF